MEQLIKELEAEKLVLAICPLLCDLQSVSNKDQYLEIAKFLKFLSGYKRPDFMKEYMNLQGKLKSLEIENKQLKEDLEKSSKKYDELYYECNQRDYNEHL